MFRFGSSPCATSFPSWYRRIVSPSYVAVTIVHSCSGNWTDDVIVPPVVKLCVNCTVAGPGSPVPPGIVSSDGWRVERKEGPFVDLEQAIDRAYELWRSTKAFHLTVLIGSRDEQSYRASAAAPPVGEET